MSCCCNPGTGTGTDGGCCCASPGFYFGVTFPTVTDVGSNTVCSVLRRDLCVAQRSCDYFVSGYYIFKDEPTGACSEGFDAFRLELIFDCALAGGTGSGTNTYTGTVTLNVYGVCYLGPPYFEISETLIASYVRSRSIWDCLGDNTMYLSTHSSDCSSWPSTVLLNRNQVGINPCTCAVAESQFEDKYMMVMGASTNTGGCSFGDCGCEIPEVRICLRHSSSCTWFGEWASPFEDGPELGGFNFIPFDPFYAPNPDSDPTVSYIGECHPASSHARYLSNSNITAATFTYDPRTDEMVFGWGILSSASRRTFRDDPVVRYTIPYSSFNPNGINTLTYDSGSYTLCQLPTTITIQAQSYSQDTVCNEGCGPCDLSMADGFELTLSGVSGPVITAPAAGNLSYVFCEPWPLNGFPLEFTTNPCSAFNGTYCLSRINGLGCTWWGVCSTKVYHDLTLEVIVPSPNPPGWTTEIHYAPSEHCYIQMGAVLNVYGGVVTLAIDFSGIFRNPFSDSHSSFQANFFPCTPGSPLTHDSVVVLYEIGASDFDCNGTNVLTLKCDGSPLVGNPWWENYSSSSGYNCLDCTGFPATVTITPTTTCGTAQDPPRCRCYPKSSYQPSVKIVGISNETCTECSCYADFEVCLDPVGASSECKWGKTFTLDRTIISGVYDPSGLPSCDYEATYIELVIGGVDAPNDATITIYKNGSRLAEYRKPLSDLYCYDTEASFDIFYSEGLCRWQEATCTLNMAETSCKACYPCDPDTSDQTIYAMYLQYDGSDVTLCLRHDGACSWVSSPTFVSTGLYLLGYMESGYYPTSFMRVFIFATSTLTGTGTGDLILIGVYNYLYDSTALTCNAPSIGVFLAAGNDGQCGENIIEPGYTVNLSGSASLVGDGSTSCSGPECDGVPMPSSLTLTIPVDWDRGCECLATTTATLVYNSVTGMWEGTIDCNGGIIGPLTVTVRQTGTSWNTLTLSYVDEFLLCGDTPSGSLSPSSGACNLVIYKSGPSNYRYYFELSW